MKKVVFISFLLLFAGCANTYRAISSSSQYDAFYQQNYKKAFTKAIKPFCRYLHHPIAVANIVHFHTLQPTKEGNYLTEYLKEALNRECKISIVPIELSKTVIIKRDGNSLLTRELQKLRNKNIKVIYGITGTYTISNNYVNIFLRLINLRTAKVIKYANIRALYFLQNPFATEETDFSHPLFLE